MLKELGTPEAELESKMVKTWMEQIEAELAILQKNKFADILEFSENGCWKDYNILNNDIVVEVAAHQILIGRKNIVSLFLNSFSEVLEETRNTTLSSTEILQLVQKLEQSFLSFSSNVYEEIVVGSTMDLQAFSHEIINTEASPFSGSSSYTFLILALFFNLIQKKHITYLIDLCQEQFRLTERLMEITLSVTIYERLDEIAKLLLIAFAVVKGSEMNGYCVLKVSTIQIG
uniref:Uncharacterized protein n=1 Tax=Panagrolaimus sp. ES5 TaxID=591445 RepID=A0AC34FJW3_9BILA